MVCIISYKKVLYKIKFEKSQTNSSEKVYYREPFLFGHFSEIMDIFENTKF